MGRKAVLLGFWVAGYVLGLVAWGVKTPVLQWVEHFGFSAYLGEALLAGFFGSTVMVATVLVWSFMSTG